MNTDTARLFLGLELDNPARRALLSVRKELEEKQVRGKLYAPQMYHLTLCFLGNTPLERIDEIKTIMDGISRDPFSLTLSALGSFKNGSILWAGVEQSNVLHDYQARLVHALREGGFPLEENEYRPHITMGRQVKSEIPPIIVPPVSFRITHSTLFESTRINNVLTYLPLYRSVFH